MARSIAWFGVEAFVAGMISLAAAGCSADGAKPEPAPSTKPATSTAGASTASASSKSGTVSASPSVPAASASAVGATTASATTASASPSASPSGSARASGSAKPTGSFGEDGLGLTGIGEGGGCPCGCDRSEKLIADLRQRGGADARDAVAFSLETIATREQGGYITERMVQHRLRLLGLDADLGGPGLTPLRRSSAHPPLRGDAATSSNGATSVRLDLIVHAEGTEIVDGEEKLLKAAFVLRMDVANQTHAPVTLARPSIATSAPFEISRWYVAGTDGTPWDGALASHEEASVVVIGYAGAPLDATTEVFADVHFDGMVIHTNARLRRHWNEVTR